MCERCEFENTISRNSDNYFILLDLKYQLKCFLETAEIQQYLNSFNFNNDNENMTDVHDGQIFKNLRSSQRKFSYTYNFNTDGAAVFNSSKLSMWPIQLVINELPPKQRFRNVILAAMWFGKCEPDMNIFMSKFVEVATDIATEGVTWVCNEVVQTSRFLPLLCCVDSVAKPMLQNMTQFNGFYGCPYCYHSGKVINRQVKYPVAENCNQKRTPSEVVSDMENSSKSNKKVRGIKGAAASINLPSFNIVWGYSIDYMHAVLLGVVRLLVDIWTTYNYHTDNLMYIGAPRNLKEINVRLQNHSTK
ncbi:hypothetical protein JTB14_017772 [Gonioctena quinquepunctata]|nr:hypothetical protein JTB14_017772 [Gonioctena quinquepunctata]